MEVIKWCCLMWTLKFCLFDIFIDVRSDVVQNGLSANLNPRLNVHAKEFTMKQGDLSTSRYAYYV